MAGIILTGDTSGTITVNAPAVAGTNILTLPAETGSVITSTSLNTESNLVRLAGETLSSDASSIEISASTLTTSYTNYELYANLKPITDGGIVFLRLRDNTATLLNTVADYSIKANRGGGTTFDDTTVSALTLISGTGNASGENEFIKYTIGDIRTSDRRCCILYSSTGTTTAGSIHAGYGVFITNVAEDNQGIQLTFSSGDIASGSSYVLYGVKG